MRPDIAGRPLCGSGSGNLGVRARDIEIDASGQVIPGRGGLSLTPDDPSGLPVEFRPKSLGGIGKLPIFAIGRDSIGRKLQVRIDTRNSRSHAYLEPAHLMNLATYQTTLCATSPYWRRYA